ncbi:UNVERIFIED_CONTAM: hypothetical protein HDU68_012102 [Siphonaria sp. JEL0065]|nr:hypothetical protein HDU68_012102 [Siphonaria sp. JEL0065]
MIVAPNKTQSKQTSTPSPTTSTRVPPQSALASSFAPRTQQHYALLVSSSATVSSSPASRGRSVERSQSPSFYRASSSASSNNKPQKSSLAAQIRSRTSSATVSASSASPSPVAKSPILKTPQQQKEPTSPSSIAIHNRQVQQRQEFTRQFELQQTQLQQQFLEYQHQQQRIQHDLYNQKYIPQQQQQYKQQQQQHQQPRRTTFTDLQIQTVNLHPSSSFPSPTTRSNILKTHTPTTTSTTQDLKIPETAHIDRNKYNLDGTRSHPQHPVPMSPLDELIDEVLMPLVVGVDSNWYHPLDGTRVHPPAIPDSVEFQKEFEEFDRIHYGAKFSGFGGVKAGGGGGVKPRGPRLNPFARAFVPVEVQSATVVRRFEDVPVQRQRAVSDVGGHGRGVVWADDV